MKNSIIVQVNIESLNLISEFLQEKAIAERLPSRKMWEILLAIDEICSQIIEIIDNDPSEIKMELTWEKKTNMIVIMIKTDCFAFNPMEIEKFKNEDEQSLEGMELSLVKQMVDEVHYFRKNNMNVLTIKKFLKSKKKKDTKAQS
ncbi:MAG: ATP-binding protein [Candidatus Omnitrophica bacterium]|nr:ATP-binding protein [Candidatus Omnitrophota bacterium]